MKLSFIIPVYKTPLQLLRNCLDSVLKYAQPMELICVLDSPGDPCEQVLDEYAAKEPRMRLLKNDQNRGVSYSRNRGMDAATGDYLAFVDADDEIIAETYEKAVVFASDKALDGCMVSVSRVQGRRFGLNYGEHFSGTIYDKSVGLRLAQAYYTAVYPMVLRHELFIANSIRFLEGHRFGEDFMVVVKLLCTGGKFAYLDLHGYRCVGHPESACRATPTMQKYLHGLISSLEVLRSIVTAGVSDEVLRWYVGIAVPMALFDPRVARYVGGDDRKSYLKILSEFVTMLRGDCGKVLHVRFKWALAITSQCLGLWFAPGMPFAMILRTLCHFGWMTRKLPERPRILVYAEAMEMGGVAVAFCEVAKEWERQGYAVKALIPYKTDLEIIRIPKRYVCGTVWKRRIKNRWVKKFLNAFNAFTRWKFYFWLTPKFEHDIFVNYLAFWNSHWCFYSKKPKIGFFHNAAPVRYGGVNERIWNHFIKSEYERYDKLIAVSDFLADGWMNRYALSKRPEVIPNLVDIDAILAKGREAVDLPKRDGMKRLLFVGRLAPVKGVDRLMNVVRRLKENGLDFDLNIVGDGPERSWMESFVKEHKLSRQVCFCGAQANPYPYMKASDLLVGASYSEGWPMTFKESLLMRCPILTTDFGNAKSRLNGGKWGVVVDSTENALYEGLRGFLTGGLDCKTQCWYDEVECMIRSEDVRNRVRIVEVLKGLKR